MRLTLKTLRQEAMNFVKKESNVVHNDLIGITDGKAVGTYIEHKFKEYLKSKYEINIGSSAKGIDLPDPEINTDIKVTSIKKPQSSSPFKNIEQKIYGLGHNLLIFVYEKIELNNKCYIDFKNYMFIEAEKTGDYNLTKTLLIMIENGTSEHEISTFLNDCNVPGDYTTLEKLARKILKNPPKQGYLTISNAFQWRLKYNNIININKDIEGVYNYENDKNDNQTPLYFTNEICNYLKNNLKINPDIIIEPFGSSNFLNSASELFDSKIYSINIDKIDIITDDIFKFNFSDKTESILIIGNAQWIDKMNISNSNSKNSEEFILKIIDNFKHATSTISFLCETTVFRNVFINLVKNKINYSFIKQINFNSKKILKNNGNFCLFIIQFGGKAAQNNICEVSDISNPSKTLYRFGFKSGKFYSNLDNVDEIEGECQIEWRQGVKHDCAKIMELTYEKNQLINKNKELVDIEDTFIYPLLKTSDLKTPIIKESTKYVLITQKKIKQNTHYIKNEAPKTWNYLNIHKQFFDNRKSHIYNNAPDFSIFGIGDYSFNKYKIIISGFVKEPSFSLAYNEKPMMVDDGCYFLSFDNYDTAYITLLILNSPLVKRFLKNIAFIDSKRPFAKKILKRIDILKCLNLLTFNDLKEIENQLDLENYLTKEKLIKYMNIIN